MKKRINKDEKEKWQRSSELMKKNSDLAIELRNNESQFHGLKREFIYKQEYILNEYRKAKDPKHPRDIGDIRENILKEFLGKSGILPTKYRISENSARVVSTTGHISNEIDILIYDYLNNISLMNRGNVYTAYPVESVYGVIQVKSMLTKKEIKNGLDNIASYKKLDKDFSNSSSNILIFNNSKSKRGFGILFAYDSDLEWIDIVNEIKNYAENNPDKKCWCNAVVILTKGIIIHGEENHGYFRNNEIENINNLNMHGIPDNETTCLYYFYDILMKLLNYTETSQVPYYNYFDLPFTAGQYSYKYSHGYFSEIGHCKKHGAFLRKINGDKLEKVIDWCKEVESINWIKAIDIAYGNELDEERYKKQPHEVKIYNPENYAFKDILLMDSTFMGKKTKSLAYEEILVNNMFIWLPYYYEITENIVIDCPKCSQKQRKRTK